MMTKHIFTGLDIFSGVGLTVGKSCLTLDVASSWVCFYKIVNFVIVGSGNGLSPVCQAIT